MLGLVSIGSNAILPSGLDLSRTLKTDFEQRLAINLINPYFLTAAALTNTFPTRPTMVFPREKSKSFVTQLASGDVLPKEGSHWGGVLLLQELPHHTSRDALCLIQADILLQIPHP